MIINNKDIPKTKIKEIIQTILNNYPTMTWLPKEEEKLLLGLLKYHPNYHNKLGVGIKGFKIKRTSYGKKGFFLYRLDGSYTDFSYLKCLNKISLLAKIKQACRNAIEQDIINFKIKKFNGRKEVKCALSGKDVTFNNCHVDHYGGSFIEIFNEWFKNKKIIESDLNTSKDNEEIIYFTNDGLKQSFRKFHNNIANLRITHPEEHLKIKNDT